MTINFYKITEKKGPNGEVFAFQTDVRNVNDILECINEYCMDCSHGIDSWTMFKEFKYFIEFDVYIETVTDMFEVIEKDFHSFHIRAMSVPDFIKGQSEEITFRIDFETLYDVYKAADILWEEDYITDEEYENFEEEYIEMYS